MAWYISSQIKKINEHCYTLIIVHTWYFFWEHKEYFIFNTMEECKEQLITSRCKGALSIHTDVVPAPKQE